MKISRLIGFFCLLGTVAVPGFADSKRIPSVLKTFSDREFSTVCNTEALQAIAEQSDAGVVVKGVENLAPGMSLPGGAKFVPASDSLPGYCQVSGSFEVSPGSGRRANFLATLPQSWNGKYLQYGCFSHCGFFLFNDATHPMVNLVAQGKPGDSLRKGYASFATDQGHTEKTLRDWAISEDGKRDNTAVGDFYYRASESLAATAKKLTTGVYSALSGEPETIARSYHAGCSGGGRDGLVAASYFPEAFDGIIVGSPYANMFSTNAHRLAQEMALRQPGVDLGREKQAQLRAVILESCDTRDGVEDGLIQNPANCDFLAERDLPRCSTGEAASNCFSASEIRAIGTTLSALIDSEGRLVHPGMSVSDLQILAPEGSGDTASDVLGIFGFANAPGFDPGQLLELARDGDGAQAQPRIRADSVAQALEAMKMGIGDMPENADDFISQGRKMLIWHNASDERLSPYISVNYVSRLAARHGGFAALDENVRLFLLPGTGHCGMSGTGPTSFDALSALEAWVEGGVAPDALVAARYEGNDLSSVPVRTMPLCRYPEMARYTGKGEVSDAANWRCTEGEKPMTESGDSGRRAGVVDNKGQQ